MGIIQDGLLPETLSIARFHRSKHLLPVTVKQQFPVVELVDI